MINSGKYVTTYYDLYMHVTYMKIFQFGDKNIGISYMESLLPVDICNIKISKTWH